MSLWVLSAENASSYKENDQGLNSSESSEHVHAWKICQEKVKVLKNERSSTYHDPLIDVKNELKQARKWWDWNLLKKTRNAMATKETCPEGRTTFTAGVEYEIVGHMISPS